MACHRSAKPLIGRGAFRQNQSCHLHPGSSQDYWGRGQGRAVCLAPVQVAPLFLGVGVQRHLVGPSRFGVACRRWVEQVAQAGSRCLRAGAAFPVLPVGALAKQLRVPLLGLVHLGS
jgi:hypothetical protein